MNDKEKTNDAIDILHRRYIGDNEDMKRSLAVERINADVAQKIYDMRKEEGLTQKELAKLVGTTQSVISRLEDADYDGHSLTMLSRIAHALKRRLIIQIENPLENDDSPKEQTESTFSGSNFPQLRDEQEIHRVKDSTSDKMDIGKVAGSASDETAKNKSKKGKIIK